MILKKLWFVVLLVSVCTIHAQTHTRKTRSDKGGHHKHSSGYYLKHGYSTGPSKSKHKRKGHGSASPSSGVPLSAGTDSLKTSQLTKEKMALEEERNGRLINAAMILGGIFLISVIGYMITQRKRKRKLEQEELDKLALERKQKFERMEQERQNALESKQKFERMEQERLDRLAWEQNEKIRMEHEKTRLENERIQLEKDKKAQLANDFKNALESNAIVREQYDELCDNLGIKTISQLEYALKDAKNKKKRVDGLLLKYPEAEVMKLLKHQYWIGMTEEQLIDAKGEPDNIEIEELKTKSKKIYVYGNKSSGDVFNFVDGRLERFKDR